MSELEAIREEYPKGFHRVDITEWDRIKRAYKGKVMTPKAVAMELGVSLEIIEKRAQAGNIHLFTLGHGYSFVPVEDVYNWGIELGQINPDLPFET